MSNQYCCSGSFIFLFFSKIFACQQPGICRCSYAVAKCEKEECLFANNKPEMAPKYILIAMYQKAYTWCYLDTVERILMRNSLPRTF